MSTSFLSLCLKSHTALSKVWVYRTFLFFPIFLRTWHEFHFTNFTKIWVFWTEFLCYSILINWVVITFFLSNTNNTLSLVQQVDFLENICIKHGWNASFPFYMDCDVQWSTNRGYSLFTLAQTYLLVKIYFACYRDRVAKFWFLKNSSFHFIICHLLNSN